MSFNQFEGILPTSITNLSSQLTFLTFGGNKIGGSIPSEISNLFHLNALDMNTNFLRGNLPASIGMHTNLQIFLVGANQLTGEIPSSLGNITQPLRLDLALNNFQGSIPLGIWNLEYVQLLALYGNKLNSTIPKQLMNISSTQLLDVSLNFLTGSLPTEIGKLQHIVKLNVSNNKLSAEVLGNIKLCGGIPELHLKPCPVQKQEKRKKRTALKLVLVIVIPALFLSLAVAFLSMLLTRKVKKKPLSSPSFGQFLPKVSYQELLNATGGFSSGNLIDSGNFGSVYNGTLSPTGITVVVKVLKLNQRGASKSFMAECEALRNIQHRNLVKLVSVCSRTDFHGNDFKALAYEFMPNGS
ncbi:unnamed protein product [Ilex paraguariensis]|uniref:Protein kinase domain-containing protein n=1 Tax=Ilex paraguariensis TaxID=185542 RepID=A0ABC8UTC1_9AQUA